MAVVQLRHLSKRYSSTEAVKDVSLDIDEGDLVVLLGPSGCGKTTTLRCIAGLESPDHGDIIIDNTRMNETPVRDRDVAMVFQNYALYPHMSVFQNIAFPLRMRKVAKSEIEARVRRVAKSLNIEHLLSRKPRQLSGGEQQRTALARSIVRQPKVFLMDEPLSNLDAKLRLYTRTEIKRLQKELNVTTIYVTHDQAEALSMADKIAIMDKGTVVQYDRPLEIYDKPGNAFVARFVGSPPMNLLDASIVHKNDKIFLDTGSFTYQLPDSISDKIKKREGKSRVILGIRPEELRLSTDQADHSVFVAELYEIEPLGSHTVVNIKVGKDILKVIIQGAFIAEIGSKICVDFPPEKMHLFDGETEEALF